VTTLEAVRPIDLDTGKLSNEIGQGWVGGPLNQLGLKARYRFVPKDGASPFDPRIPAHVVESRLTLGDWHTGYPATIHGGAVGAWLDDGGARVASMAFPPGMWAVTKELRTRYYVDIVPHTDMTLEVYLAQIAGVELVVRGKVKVNGQAVVRSEGRYAPMSDRMRRRILLATGLKRICV
jgi:acyl-coenzyme A thioesterase PaaI-like protein